MCSSLPGRGFTMIELLISVVIGGILLNALLASYRGIGKKQTVKQAGISFQTDLKSYQQKALTGTKPVECDASETLIGYKIEYIDSRSYRVKALCSVSEIELGVVNLPETVSFSSAFNPGVIVFPVLNPAVIGSQTIELTNSAYQYEVVLEPSGVIRGQML